MLRPKLPPNLWDNLAALGLRPWMLFAGFLAGCNLGYGLLLWMFAWATAQMLTFLLTGCVVAEAGILAAWLVWGRRPLWQRLCLHVGAATILVVLGIVGILPWLDPRAAFWTQFVPWILLSLPAVGVGLAAPLWVARLFFGWRIVSAAHSDTTGDRLSIRDFLVGMAVVGAALALARLGKDFQPYPVWAYWLRLGIAVAIAAAGGVLEVPIVWFTFRFQSPLWCAIAVGVTMLIPWSIIVTVGTAMEGQIPDGRAVAGLCLLFLSTGYIVALAFRLTRAAGYRLQIGTRQAG